MNNENSPKSKIIIVVACFAVLFFFGSSGSSEQPPFSFRSEGVPGNTFKIQLEEEGKRKSFWHDIPWTPSEATAQQHVVNIVTEIPQGTCAKMETIKERECNPILQDVKHNMPRYYAMGPIPFNYGMIPQTWESTLSHDLITGMTGDNDPIDVVDISAKPHIMASINRVKVLGAIPMLDGDETDWKIITISVTDPRAESYDSVFDLPSETLTAIQDWLLNYKSTDCRKLKTAQEYSEHASNVNAGLHSTSLLCNDSLYFSDRNVCVKGKPEAKFFSLESERDDKLDIHFLSPSLTMDVIRHTHNEWMKLVDEVGPYAGNSKITPFSLKC